MFINSNKLNGIIKSEMKNTSDKARSKYTALMFNELEKFLPTISPGASIGLNAEDVNSFVIKTPHSEMVIKSNDTPKMLQSIFSTDFPHLKGEEILIESIHFSERYAKKYFELLKIFEKYPSLLDTIVKLKKNIAPKLIKELIDELQILITSASSEAFLEFIGDGIIPEYIHTPHRKMFCDHLIEIVVVLSCIHPVDETALISWIEFATEAGEVLQELHVLIYRKRTSLDDEKMRELN